ncbi:hypothetical protein SFC43_13690 [Bacteroides sp. CR5/BHMF/2]|nr:hypothetical protein [Bacteroides sp. CR5/BHMF/2]
MTDTITPLAPIAGNEAGMLDTAAPEPADSVSVETVKAEKKAAKEKKPKR